MSASISSRLEKYSSKHPEEVLIVNLQKASGEADTLIIFNGYSSSLVHPTIYDPDVPLISQSDRLNSLDRTASPYNPADPQYLQTNLTWEEMEQLLIKEGI